MFVWHDILYDGPRNPGWPDEETLRARAEFLEDATGGGLDRELVVETLRTQYKTLEDACLRDEIVLWFDACLFDQAMLSHILACMSIRSIDAVQLICVDAFPGIVPFDGLGQIHPHQLASLYGGRRFVTKDQFRFAGRVDRAFARQDQAEFLAQSNMDRAPLPWVPAAAARWLLEQPDASTGLRRLEELALQGIRSGLSSPSAIFRFVAANDAHPHFWGDNTLWAGINRLATRTPPLAVVDGPAPLLPQWDAGKTIESFSIHPAPAESGPASRPERA